MFETLGRGPWWLVTAASLLAADGGPVRFALLLTIVGPKRRVDFQSPVGNTRDVPLPN